MREISSIEGLPRGVVGTRKTLDKMHRLVALGKADPTIQRIATWIRLRVPEDPRGSGTATVDRVFSFVREHGIFQRDPFQIEKIEHPIAAMAPVVEARLAGAYRGPGLFVGDCDTISGVYLASLLGALGFHYAWEVAKVDPTRPDEFSHVWVAAMLDGRWYPMDPSTRGVRPGWRPTVPPALFARFPEPLVEEVLGMGGMNGDENNGGYVPEDQYVYGIPKSFEGDLNQSHLPDPGEEVFLGAGPTPMIPRADLEPGVESIAKRPVPPPNWRPSLTEGDMSGPQRVSAPTGGRILRDSRQLPPGSLWNRIRIDDRERYPGRKGYIAKQRFDPRIRDVEVAQVEPFAVRRRNGMATIHRLPSVRHVVLRPTRIPAGMGEEAAPKPIFSLDQLERESSRESAGVWDTIASTLKDVLPTLTKAGASALEAKYATAVAKATNRVVGAPVATAGQYLMPKAWYESPWVWVGGIIVVGGVAYAATR